MRPRQRKTADLNCQCGCDSPYIASSATLKYERIPLTFKKHNEWAGETRVSSNNCVRGGGKRGSPAKLSLTMSHIISISPVAEIRYDDYKSLKMDFLNSE
jgi:hypothetical protein